RIPKQRIAARIPAARFIAPTPAQPLRWQAFRRGVLTLCDAGTSDRTVRGQPEPQRYTIRPRLVRWPGPSPPHRKRPTPGPVRTLPAGAADGSAFQAEAARTARLPG